MLGSYSSLAVPGRPVALLFLELVKPTLSPPPHLLHVHTAVYWLSVVPLPPPSPEGHGGMFALSSSNHTFLS